MQAEVIWVYSPNVTLSTALCSYVETIGYRAQLAPSGARLAVFDLSAYGGAYIPPAEVPTLALLGPVGRDLFVKVLHLGYRGYLRPGDPADHLDRALRTLIGGGVWAEKSIIEEADDPAERPPLTPRELQVLSLLKLGMSNKRIGVRLGIAEKTVKIHVSRELRKCEVDSRLTLLVQHAHPWQEALLERT